MTFENQKSKVMSTFNSQASVAMHRVENIFSPARFEEQDLLRKAFQSAAGKKREGKLCISGDIRCRCQR